ncbi:MAG: PSD1 domain-containing protein [Planctomyces sp.]|nr:PSD1 domain-containing protein [Planctomyces sp.]
MRSSVLRVAFCLALLPLLAEARAAADDQAAAGDDSFSRDVKPVLEMHCVRCHSGEEPEAGLRLTSRESMLAGGDSGPVIDLERPQDSLLISAVTYDGFEMPPTGKMPQAKIDAIVNWVQGGAAWPEGVTLHVEEHAGPPQVNDETKNHWSFRHRTRPEVPAVRGQDWVANPIDAFVLKKLEDAELSPAPAADRRALIRRVTYDLTGLPPTLEEVEAFARDEAPDAYERLIDRLLDSPQHGEHWARLWLDVVRYAETNSFERDNPKPFVWRYRDYVIRALNDDKPYDRFIIEQLAGDELPERTAETIIATGFYRLGLWDDEPADPELAFYDGLDDIATTAGQGFLGLTMNCARCHDHKLDPIPLKDYYSFIAFFRNVRHYGERSDESVQRASLRSIATAEEIEAQTAELARHQSRMEELNREIDAIEQEVRPRLVGGEADDFQSEGVRESVLSRRIGEVITQEQFEEYRRLRRERNRLRRNPPRSGEQALCVTERGPDVPPTHVLLRGSPQAPDEEVAPAFPQVLSPPEPDIRRPASGESSGRRLALAEWIASADNPLTARVAVNRIWQGHFGRGIVRSTNNFGLQGDAPTHPELIDWLAEEFVANGWSMKALHRTILLSNTYRQSSRHAPPADGQPDPLQIDPQNDLFWRFDMRRLKAEEVRDSILAVNGSLNLDSMFGPSVYVKIPDEVLAGQSRPGYGWGRSSAEDERRRSIYIHVKRSLTVPILASFDVADTDTTCPVRFASTQPTQALGLLNSEFANSEAETFARLVAGEVGSDREAQVRRAIERTCQRPASDPEIERGMALISDLEQLGQSPEAALKNFCLLALNLNEFLYLD